MLSATSVLESSSEYAADVDLDGLVDALSANVVAEPDYYDEIKYA
jgi:hypothetical protein